MTTKVSRKATPQCTALAPYEAARLAQLEAVIAEGMQTFVDVGKAIAEINESLLYRSTHPTFEAYCKDRWGFTPQRAYQLMDAAEVHEQVPEAANERQARTLASVPKEEQSEVWADAKERARQDGAERPTAKHVEEAVRARLLEPEPEPEPDPEEPEADLALEMEDLIAENDRLRAQVAALTTDDAVAALAEMHMKYGQLEARVQALMEEKQALVKRAEKAEWASGLMSEVMRLVGVDKPGKLVAAVRALKGE
jgi:hypothetical protein